MYYILVSKPVVFEPVRGLRIRLYTPITPNAKKDKFENQQPCSKNADGSMDSFVDFAGFMRITIANMSSGVIIMVFLRFQLLFRLGWRCVPALLVLFGGSFGGGGGAVAADNAITALRLGAVAVDAAPALRLVIETQSPATVKMTLLSDPYRLVVDMMNAEWQIKGLPTRGALNKSPASGYRFGHPEPGVGRLVIEFDAPAAPFRAFALPPNTGGHRLVIDMVDGGQTAFRVAAAALRDSQPIQFGGGALAREPVASEETEALAFSVTPPVPKPTPTPTPKVTSKLGPKATPNTELLPNKNESKVALPSLRPKRWVVFIDAGHGGKDPGAIGRRGTKEKVITLAAATELARQLMATGKVRAVLSRTDDRFLKLRQRIRLARSHNADLFISLHADSAASKAARGMSIFTLSETASDKEAASLARTENQADLIGGPDLAVEDADAANELLRMFQRESMNQSTFFAGRILNEIRDLPGGDKRGHRFAGFAVLKAPDMPSVLVEMGFLSNASDEANLNQPSYRQKIAARLTKAVVKYLEEFGPQI